MSPFVLFSAQAQLENESAAQSGGTMNPDTVPDTILLLPGTGKVTRPGECGKPRPGKWEVCSHDHNHQKSYNPTTCGKPECPICWTTWAKREAHRQSAGLIAYQNRNGGQRTLFDGFSEKGKAPRHDIISPPLSAVRHMVAKTHRQLDKNGEPIERFGYYFLPIFNREINKMLELSGIDGAKVVSHMFRIRPEYKDRINKEVSAGLAADRYDWVKKHSNWYDYLYFSPHVHLVTFGWNIDNFYELSGGWTYKAIREVYDAPGLMYYLLSHTSIIEGRNAVRSWGCLSKHNMKKLDEWQESEPAYCGKCGSYLEYADCDDDGNLNTLMGREVQRRVKCYLYEIKMGEGLPPRQVKVKSSPIETKYHNRRPAESDDRSPAPGYIPKEKLACRDRLKKIREDMKRRRTLSPIEC